MTDQQRSMTCSPPDMVDVAIPCFNASATIRQALESFVANDRVHRIVVYDDGSTPGELRETIDAVAGLESDKVRLYSGDQNLGAFKAKMTAVSLCDCDWVLVFDADNEPLDDYVDILADAATDPLLFYGASYAPTAGDWRHMAGRKIGAQEIAEYVRSKRDGKSDMSFISLINDGNYLVHRKVYLAAACTAESINCGAADVPFLLFYALKLGVRLYVTPDAIYVHHQQRNSYWRRDPLAPTVYGHILASIADGKQWLSSYGLNLSGGVYEKKNGCTARGRTPRSLCE